MAAWIGGKGQCVGFGDGSLGESVHLSHLKHRVSLSSAVLDCFVREVPASGSFFGVVSILYISRKTR